MLIRICLVALMAAGSVAAQDQDLDPDIDAGQDLFANHCIQCHGYDATGNGPMAEILSIQTPDLTRLSARNGGVFPLEEAARQIDGRAPLLAHGGEMPVYGPFFETDQHLVLRLPSGQPMMTGVPLADLLAYLESIQTP